MFKRRNSSYLIGLSLIELIISIFLSSFILLSFSSLSILSKRNLSQSAAWIELSFNAERSQQIMQNLLSIAGNLICTRWQKEFPIQNLTTIKLENPVEITKNNYGNQLSMWGGDVRSGLLIKPYQGGNRIYVSHYPHFKANDIILLADCTHAVIAIVQAVIQNEQYQVVELHSYLNTEFFDGAAVTHLQINHFFVAQTKRLDVQGKRILALYWQNSIGEKQELVSGVQAMQVSLSVEKVVYLTIQWKIKSENFPTQFYQWKQFINFI